MNRRHSSSPDSRTPAPSEGPVSASWKSLQRLQGHAPAVATPTQVRTVVKRLRVLLGEAIEQSKRVGVEVTPPKLVHLCDELLREVAEPGYRPPNDGSVESFFWSGVFDELVQQPSNIFDEVSSPEGTAYYVPLTPETWRACLQQLRLTLSPSE